MRAWFSGHPLRPWLQKVNETIEEIVDGYKKLLANPPNGRKFTAEQSAGLLESIEPFRKQMLAAAPPATWVRAAPSQGEGSPDGGL
jgi:hypothetical protein